MRNQRKIKSSDSDTLIGVELIGIVSPDSKKIMKKYLLILLILFILIYFYSMVLQPLIISDFDYKFLMETWHIWQSWNAAVLAFLSAILIFSTRINIERHRRKNSARAARAFLSHPISMLTKTCISNSDNLFTLVKHFNRKYEKWENPKNTAPKFSWSPFGENFFPYFKESIKLEDGDLSPELSEILSWMQILEARYEVLKERLEIRTETNGYSHITAMDINQYFIDTVCLKFRLERIFNYARGISKEFSQSDITIDNLQGASMHIKELPFESGNELFEYAQSYLENKRYVLKDKTTEKTE